MEKFLLRKDRFELFDSFENPLINITFKLEVPDFRDFSKSKNIPPFHFFLFSVFQSIMQIENFRYRIIDGKVTTVDQLIPSYTVMNKNNDLNFTRFEFSSDIYEFVKRSLKSRDESVNSEKLLHIGIKLSEEELKKYVFITCIPWLDFTAIEHPVSVHKSSDIPSIAWGRMIESEKGKLTMSFSIQAHHGFVDGHHIHMLGSEIGKNISLLIDTL